MSDLWTAWQLFPLDDDPTCDSKNWVGDWVGFELLYNSVKTEVRQLQLEIGLSYRRDVVGKATSGRRGLGALMSWGPERLLIRCSKESHQPAECASGPPVEHQENEKDTTLTAIRVEVKILKFLFGLQLPLTCKPWITFSNPYNKMRGTYFVKEVFLRASVYYCVVI